MTFTEPVTFVCAYVLACVAFLPVSPLTLGAGALFGTAKGFLLVWTGATLGSCASFLIGRHALRFFIEKRIARHPLWAAIDAAVSAQGWRVVFLTRLTPLFPFTLLNYAYGLTRVSLGEFALASMAGMAPATLFFVHVGATAGAAARGGWSSRTPAEWALAAAGLLTGAATVWFVGREARRELAKRSAA